MPADRIGADQNAEADVHKAFHDMAVPGRGTNGRRWQVAAFGIVARETEGHGHDRDRCAVIEGGLIKAQPVAQSIAGRVGEGLAALIDARARRLACDQDTRRRVEPGYGSGGVGRLCFGKPVCAELAGLYVLGDLCH